MRHFIKLLQLLVVISVLLPLALKGGETETRKSFKNIKEVKIQDMNAHCRIRKNTGPDVVVMYENNSQEGLKTRIKQSGDTLLLVSKIGASDEDFTWNLLVPEDTDIKFTSMAGDFSAEGLKGRIRAKTLTGAIEAKNCSGEIFLRTISGLCEVSQLSGEITLKATNSRVNARKITGLLEITNTNGEVDVSDISGKMFIKVVAGDVEISNASGQFEVKSAAGDINGDVITLEGPASFKVASGDVRIELAKSPVHDLSLDSASGDAVLNYNGNALKGQFIFTALKDDGRIKAPFKFQKESTKEKWGKTFVVKSFSKGTDVPVISIKTASGKAVLKLK